MNYEKVMTYCDTRPAQMAVFLLPEYEIKADLIWPLYIENTNETKTSLYEVQVIK